MLDPDLEIGGEGRSSRLLEKGGGGEVSKIFFKPFGPQFGLKISGGPAPQTPPLDPPLLLYILPFCCILILECMDESGDL